MPPARGHLPFTKYFVLLLLLLATPVAHEILPPPAARERPRHPVSENEFAPPAGAPAPAKIQEAAFAPLQPGARIDAESGKIEAFHSHRRGSARPRAWLQNLPPAHANGSFETLPSGLSYRLQPGLHWGRFALAQTLTIGIGGYGFYHYNSLFGRVGQPFKIGNDWNKDHSLHFDELLHFQGGYRITQAVSSLYRWAGVPPQTADWIGFGTSALLMTSLEYVDGRRKNDEASYSDLAANFLGMGFALARSRASWMQDFDLRLSYRTLADPFRRSTVKRYDRLTHWLTYDLSRRWKIPLHVGLGYSVANARKPNAQAQYYFGIGISPRTLVAKFSPGAAKTLAWLDFYHLGNQVALNSISLAPKNARRKP